VAGHLFGHDFAFQYDDPEKSGAAADFLFQLPVGAGKRPGSGSDHSGFRHIKGKLKDNTLFKTFVPDDPSLVSELRERGVLIDVKPEEDRGFWITMLASWGPSPAAYRRLGLFSCVRCSRGRKSDEFR
jgi:hypothetical protein